MFLMQHDDENKKSVNEVNDEVKSPVIEAESMIDEVSPNPTLEEVVVNDEKEMTASSPAPSLDQEKPQPSVDSKTEENRPESNDGPGEEDLKAKSDQSPQPKSPKKAMFFIILLFCVLPLLIYYMGIGNQKDAPIILSSSMLHQHLLKGEVANAACAFESKKPVQVITGTLKGPKKRQFRAEVVYTDELGALLNKQVGIDDYDYKVSSNDSPFREMLFSLIPMILIMVVIFVIFSKKMSSAGRGAMSFGKSKAKLNDGNGKVTFADVAGLDQSKEEVTEIVEFLKDPSLVRELGGKVPKGVLLVGPPGTGKTLLARAMAGEADAPFYTISGSDFVEMFVGVGASRVRDMFSEAKKNAPCLIFIDEIDAVGRARFAGVGGGNDEREQTLNAMLVEMDGFEANSGVIVVAATNRPDVLDKALLRPGRFDRQVMINLPDRKGRKEILEVHAKNIKVCESIDFSVIARNTPGFSGADLANLLNEAALTAARTKKKVVEMSDIEEAKEKILWGRERKGYHMSEQNRRNTAFHEAGHALVGLHLEHATPLHKVTIIPRGNFLGAAMYLPSDDEVSKTKNQLKAQLAVAMGGRIAEELVFDDVTTGASGDIVAATGLAKKMVCQYGMSENMGLIDYAPNRDNPYASASDSTKGSQHSEETSNKIDLEVRRLVDEAVATARQILTDHRAQLDLFANALIEKETMEVEEICNLVGIDAALIDKERFGPKATEPKPEDEPSTDEKKNEEEK